MCALTAQPIIRSCLLPPAYSWNECLNSRIKYADMTMFLTNHLLIKLEKWEAMTFRFQRQQKIGTKGTGSIPVFDRVPNRTISYEKQTDTQSVHVLLH